MGTLSSMLPGLSNARVLLLVDLHAADDVRRGKVNLPDAIEGAMLNALGGSQYRQEGVSFHALPGWHTSLRCQLVVGRNKAEFVFLHSAHQMRPGTHI